MLEFDHVVLSNSSPSYLSKTSHYTTGLPGENHRPVASHWQTLSYNLNIPFSATDTKKVLYEKIKQKKTPVVYEVLRTPVRHCELNPIELIWAQVKGFVAKNNTTFRLKDVKELTYAAFGKITKDVWTKAEEHVIKIEKEYCKKKPVFS